MWFSLGQQQPFPPNTTYGIKENRIAGLPATGPVNHSHPGAGGGLAPVERALRLASTLLCGNGNRCCRLSPAASDIPGKYNRKAGRRIRGNVSHLTAGLADIGDYSLHDIRQTLRTLHPEPAPVCAGGNPGVSLEEVAKKRDILITDSVADLLHCAMVALQQAFSGGDPQFL